MNIYTIYKATNKINGKSYIGFDSNWPTRISNHKRNAIKKGGRFYTAIRKYGWEEFEWSVLYQSHLKEHTHLVMEEYFIREYNSHVDFGHGYNMSMGGDGGNRSMETRKKMSNSAKNRSEEHKRKLKGKWEKGCVAWNKGLIGVHTRSEEFKQNLRKPKSEEFKQNLRKPLPKVVCRVTDRKEMAIQQYTQWLKRIL
jgi:group I intron endonuclease